MNPAKNARAEAVAADADPTTPETPEMVEAAARALALEVLRPRPKLLWVPNAKPNAPPPPSSNSTH